MAGDGYFSVHLSWPDVCRLRGHRLTVAITARTIDEMHDAVARLGDELVAPTAEL